MKKTLISAILICLAFATPAFSKPPHPPTVDDAVVVYDKCRSTGSKKCIALSDLDNTAAINAEATDRAAADDALTDRVNAEATDRAAADDALTDRVDTNRDNIDSVGDRVNHVNSSHGVFTNAINNNANDIATNRQLTTNNSKKIKRLDLRINDVVDELESIAAQSAAMAGLPQPYGIGNSMLSVGIGHYSGTNALALGFSHRCSEGVVAKFGISSSDNRPHDTLINGSVGFEF